MNQAMEGCPNETTYYNTTMGKIAVPQWEAILTITTLTIIIVLTIIGNILVILSIFTHKPLRIVQNFFIVSLAVADLTVAILVMPFNIAYSILGQWSFGTPACKLWVTADVLCCTASILNLCMIALDRFWAITDPINYATKRTLKRVLYFIMGIWVLSLLISSPPLFFWSHWHEDDESICELTQTQGYVVYSALGSFFIPLVIMGIVYIQIYFAMRRRLRERANTLHKSMTNGGTLKMKKIDKEPEKGPYENVDGGTEPGFVERFIQEKQKISLSMERRAARVLGIVMGVFVVCWLPFFLMYVINPFCSSCCPTSRLKNFITWLGYVNSTLNPIIYTIFNKDFRTAFKKLLGMKT